MAVTLSDIARECGVNTSTVSKALRGSTDINAETSAQIMCVANRLGYKIKSEKRGQFSKEIIIVCPEIFSAYYSVLTETLSKLLYGKGYMPHIAISHFDEKKELEILDYYLKKLPAAIICITESANAAEMLQHVSNKKGTAILLVTLNNIAKECDNICVDEEMCMDYAVQHLINLGHRKIGFIGESLTQDRMAMFQRFTKKHGIETPKEYIVSSEYRFSECGYTGMKQLLSIKERPTAVITAYDDIALGAMRMITESGYSVPDDFSIIGFDNAHYSSYLTKSLTTIDSKISDMCAIAVGILDKKIRDKGFSVIQNVTIKPDLLIRETTRAI